MSLVLTNLAVSSTISYLTMWRGHNPTGSVRLVLTNPAILSTSYLIIRQTQPTNAVCLVFTNSIISSITLYFIMRRIQSRRCRAFGSHQPSSLLQHYILLCGRYSLADVVHLVLTNPDISSATFYLIIKRTQLR